MYRTQRGRQKEKVAPGDNHVRKKHNTPKTQKKKNQTKSKGELGMGRTRHYHPQAGKKKKS